MRPLGGPESLWRLSRVKGNRTRLLGVPGCVSGRPDLGDDDLQVDRSVSVYPLAAIMAVEPPRSRWQNGSAAIHDVIHAFPCDVHLLSVSSRRTALRSDSTSNACKTMTTAVRSAGTDGRPRPDGNRSSNIDGGSSFERCSAKNACSEPSPRRCDRRPPRSTTPGPEPANPAHTRSTPPERRMRIRYRLLSSLLGTWRAGSPE